MIDRERGLWCEQFSNVTIHGSATPRVAGGDGGGEVANELRDLGIHRMNSRSTTIAAPLLLFLHRSVWRKKSRDGEPNIIHATHIKY